MVTHIDVIPLLRVPYGRNDAFTYGVPSSIAPRAVRGAFVRVPFRTRSVWGICIATHTGAPLRVVRAIAAIDASVRLTDEEIAIIETLAAHYRCARSTVARLLIPSPPLRAERLFDASYKKTPLVADPPAHGDSIVIPTTQQARLNVLREFSEAIIRARQSVLICTPYRAWLPRIASALAPLPCVTFDPARGTRAAWAAFVAGRNHPSVVITTRGGACFAPERLGGIVVDLAHEDDHKSWDMQPRYDVRDITARIARARGIPRLLVSPTPRPGEWWGASRRSQVGPPLPVPTLIRLDAHWRSGGKGLCTDALIEAIRDTVAAGRVALVLHNRRGRLGRISCADCGRIERCGTCERLLMEYDDGLRCTTCQSIVPTPTICVACASPYLQFRGMGTAGVRGALARVLPDLRIATVDRDTPDTPPRDAQVIVATERYTNSIAPHDDHLIGLVAVLHAERYVRSDDYRGAERLLASLRDVAVWANTWGATLLLQTSDPDHPVFRTTLASDLAAWYRGEIAEREALSFPPSARLLRCDTPPGEHDDAAAFIHLLSTRERGTVLAIDGPYDFGTVRARRVTSVLVRMRADASDADIARIVAAVPSAWSVDLDPISIQA